MKNYISKVNASYIDNWIKLNPNLKDFSYENNILKTPTGETIDLQSFLVSDLLNNDYFKNNEYTISSNEFIKIIKLHVEAENILTDYVFNNEDESQNNEYVKNVKLNQYGNPVIFSSESKIYEIKDKIASEVLIEYQSLIKECGNYVPLKKFLKKIKKEELINTKPSSNQYLLNLINIKFFNLINSNASLNLRDSTYIQNISKFIFLLLINQDLLTGNAQKLLDLYNIELNRLASLDTLNTNQQYALHYYKNNLENYENYKKEQEKKEAATMNRASNGYTSLILLLTSILITGIFLSILYFK